MDAVGRVITTDSMLYALTLRKLEGDFEPSSVLDTPAERGEKVVNLSQEFQDVVENILGLNGRDRLSFYLIDYIDWFNELYDATSCYRINCRLLRPEIETQVIHLIEQEGQWAFLSIITVSRKPTTPAFNTPGPFDTRK